MTYEEFLEFVPAKCMYETIYDDSEGRTILVISLLDAYGMVNKAKQMQSSVDKAVNRMAQPAQQEPVALVISGVLVKSKFPENYTGHLYTTPPQRTWVGLTDREKSNLWLESRAAIPRFHTYASLVEAKLREKNQ